MHIQDKRYERSHQTQQCKAEESFIRSADGDSGFVFPVCACADVAEGARGPPAEEREGYGPEDEEGRVQAGVEERVEAVEEVEKDRRGEGEEGQEGDGK